MQEDITLDSNQAKFNCSTLGFAFILYMVLAELACSLANAGVTSLLADSGKKISDIGGLGLILGTLPMYLIAFPITYLMMKRIPKVEIKRRKVTFAWFITMAFISLTLMIAGAVISEPVVQAFGDLFGIKMSNPINTLSTGAPIYVVIPCFVIIAPIMEELLFRKLLIDRIGLYSMPAAVITSGLFFAFFHTNIYQFFYALFVGLVLAGLYANTGNLKTVILLHMVVNGFSILIDSLQKVFGLGVQVVMYIYVAIVVVGWFLLLFHFKALLVKEKEPHIEKSQRKADIYFTPGMIFFYLLCIALTIYRYLA